MARIGLSIFDFQARYGDKRAIEIAAQLGVDAVDFSTAGRNYDITNPDSLYSRSDEELCEYLSDVRAYAEKLGVQIASTHGRLRLTLLDDEKDRLCMEMARKDLLAAKALGASVTVMHGVQTNVLGPNVSAEYMRDLHFRKFNEVLGFAKKYGVKLASETLGDAPNFGCVDFFADPDEFLAMYERICADGDNADWFGFCIDTGHIRKAERYGTPGVAEFIRRVGKGRILCLHLHDNYGMSDQHLPPLTGSIDWNSVFSALDEVGYDGIYNMEAVFNCFKEGFEMQTAKFAVDLLRFALERKQK